MRIPLCVVLLISMAGFALVASDYQAQRKQQDVARANYWKERGYTFNPQFMNAYAMDQKVKDSERANYWKERGYDFNAQFMTAYAMDQKVKDFERANYWKERGYDFKPQFMTAYAMDQKVKDIEKARELNAKGYSFNPQFMTAYAMEQKVKDIGRANYWKQRGYDFNPQFMTAYAMDQKVKAMQGEKPPSEREYRAIKAPDVHRNQLDSPASGVTIAPPTFVSQPSPASSDLVAATVQSEQKESTQEVSLTTAPSQLGAPSAALSPERKTASETSVQPLIMPERHAQPAVPGNSYSGGFSAVGAVAGTASGESDSWVAPVVILAAIGLIAWLISKSKSSRSSNRHQASRPAGGGAATQREEIVTCHNCGQRNRLREVDGQSLFRCGSCHLELANPFASLPHSKPEPVPTFRPSAAMSSRAKHVAFRDTSADDHLVAPSDLAGVVDAFTGEALNAALGLYQCGKCQVYYHRASYDVIRNENGGQCVACLGTSIRGVSLAQPHRDSRPASGEARRQANPLSNYRPDAVTLFNYRDHIGRAVTFESFVPKVLSSRRGRDFAIMFENLDWKAGFKAIVFRRHLAAVGGVQFVRSLQGRTIRVRGLVQKNPIFGFEIVVTERSMIQEIR
jgi:hypothetical protein